MANEGDRLVRLEQAIGFRLPPDYRSFLSSHVEDADRPIQVVASNPDYLDVRTIFELGDGANYLQADEVHRIAGDALPPGMVAIADDGGGSFYLLDCRDTREVGSVYWWDHEQQQGEDRIDLVAPSFTEFLGSLLPDPDN
jgi:SMI1 / KNR4 family (SUKH-1)